MLKHFLKSDPVLINLLHYHMVVYLGKHFKYIWIQHKCWSTMNRRVSWQCAMPWVPHTFSVVLGILEWANSVFLQLSGCFITHLHVITDIVNGRKSTNRILQSFLELLFLEQHVKKTISVRRDGSSLTWKIALPLSIAHAKATHRDHQYHNHHSRYDAADVEVI